MEKRNRQGTPGKSRDRRPVDVRFWARVEMIPFHSCWEWTGPLHNSGYGAISAWNYPWKSHRLSWVLHNGAIPDGQWVLHHCDNRTCVNPDHLYLGNAQQNTNDKLNRGRHKSRTSKVVDGIIVCPRGHAKVFVERIQLWVCRVCMNSWHKRNPERFRASQRKYKQKIKEAKK